MATYLVSTASELTAALSRAVGGDVINLAEGNYGNVAIRHFKPTSTVTIQSADPDRPAHFDTMIAHTTQNLTFKGLDIGRALLPGEVDYTQLTTVRVSSNIVFDDVHIHGSLDGNAQNDGYGLLVDKVNALTIINSQFTQLTRGVVLSEIVGLRVADNKFNDMRTDGIDVTGSKSIVMERNVFQGFYPFDYDHPDAMQFFNLGYAEPMSDVTIRDNVLLPGGDYGPQGIWIAGGGEAGFRNFTIENNMMWSDGFHNGIGLFGLIGGRVAGNTVLSPTNDAKVYWIRAVDSSDIDIVGNIAEDYLIGPNATDIRMADNVNLRLNPELRGQMTDVNNPRTASDVIIDGVGYQLPKPITVDAPVSGVISTAFNGMLSGTMGASLGRELVGADHVDLTGLGDILGQAEASHVPVFDLPPEPVQGMTMHQYLTGDWFTALP